MSRYGLERHNETLLRLSARWQQALDDQRAVPDAATDQGAACDCPGRAVLIQDSADAGKPTPCLPPSRNAPSPPYGPQHLETTAAPINRHVDTDGS